MRNSFATGLSFGLTSGVITTLGLMIGLAAGTNLKVAVVGGILTIAIADACSDALGIHVSEESKHGQTTRHVWEATLATFVSKFVFALSFLIPVITLPLSSALWVSIGWGAVLLITLSLLIARSRQEKPGPVIAEHLFIAAIVILATHLVGQWLARTFG